MRLQLSGARAQWNVQLFLYFFTFVPFAPAAEKAHAHWSPPGGWWPLIGPPCGRDRGWRTGELDPLCFHSRCPLLSLSRLSLLKYRLLTWPPIIGVYKQLLLLSGLIKFGCSFINWCRGLHPKTKGYFGTNFRDSALSVYNWWISWNFNWSDGFWLNMSTIQIISLDF